MINGCRHQPSSRRGSLNRPAYHGCEVLLIEPISHRFVRVRLSSMLVYIDLVQSPLISVHLIVEGALEHSRDSGRLVSERGSKRIR